MRTTLALLCVLGTSFAGLSQDKNFDLSKYKFPDYKRHELELNFNSSGRGERFSGDGPLTNSPNLSRYKDSNVNTHSYLNVGYSYEYFTRQWMNYIHSTLNSEYNFQKENDRGVKTKLSNPRVDWDFQASSRYYLVKDKIFLEGLTDMQFIYSNTRSTGADNITSTIRNSTLILSAGMGVGYGRIEKVSDLWQAYYILAKLNGQKSLGRELQEKDVFEFARLASKLKNKRFFDARLRKIGELQALDSLMQSQGLVRNADIAYFTTLNDYWSYGNFQDRKSGRELKIYLIPSHERSYYKFNNLSELSSKITTLVSKIQYDRSKQLNLFWERNLHLEAANTTYLESHTDVEYYYPDNLKSANASLEFGFFPDSRTSFNLSGGYLGNEQVHSNGEKLMKYWSNSLLLGLQANYYISPQLQISGNVVDRYWFSKYNSSNSNTMNYSLSLRYAIF